MLLIAIAKLWLGIYPWPSCAHFPMWILIEETFLNNWIYILLEIHAVGLTQHRSFTYSLAAKYCVFFLQMDSTMRVKQMSFCLEMCKPNFFFLAKLKSQTWYQPYLSNKQTTTTKDLTSHQAEIRSSAFYLASLWPWPSWETVGILSSCLEWKRRWFEIPSNPYDSKILRL